jgi:hypothetical protein
MGHRSKLVMKYVHPITGHHAISDATYLVETYGYTDALALIGMLKQSDSEGREYWREVEFLIMYIRVQGGEV